MTKSQTSTKRRTMLSNSLRSQRGYYQNSVRKVQSRSSQESFITFDVVFSNYLPLRVKLSLRWHFTLFSGEVIIFQSSSSMIKRSLSKIFQKLMISNSEKAYHSPEIFLRELMIQRLNQSPWMMSLLKVRLICGWRSCVLRQFLILLVTYSMRVQISLKRQSLRQKVVFPLLLNAYYKIRQDSSSFTSFPSFFASNYSTFVIDLFTKIRLRLNYSILVISFLLSALTAFTIFGCSKSSFQLMRYSGSLHSILLMRPTRSYERLLGGIINFLTFNSLKYSLIDRYFLPWSKKGYQPLNAILYSTIPNEKTSILEFPYFAWGISGAIYIGVPFMDMFQVVSGSTMALERPKSAILKSPLWISIFSGLISLWRSECSQSTRQPSQNCFKKNHILSSVMLYLQSNINLSRLPPLQNSMMRQRFFSLDICIFLQLTKLGCEGSSFRICNSFLQTPLAHSSEREITLLTSSYFRLSKLQALTIVAVAPRPCTSKSIAYGEPQRRFTFICFLMIMMQRAQGINNQRIQQLHL